jgi:two-component system chemotaxis sensor kinase CheA
MDLVNTSFPEWVTDRQANEQSSRSGRTVLLAEDSDFFRGQVRKHIENGGYRVLCAEDGQVAWQVLSDNVGKVDMLVTDVEMPRLNGLELTRKIRSDGRFENLPIVALSSLAGEDDMARGLAAGVSEYLVKLDGEKLIETIRRLLQERAPAKV